MTGTETGCSETPTPIATSDSPSATIRISWCRSAKWAALCTRQPDVPVTQMPA